MDAEVLVSVPLRGPRAGALWRGRCAPPGEINVLLYNIDIGVEWVPIPDSRTVVFHGRSGAEPIRAHRDNMGAMCDFIGIFI